MLYTGFDKGGVFVKMSLEEAAAKVKISKKSLDDYLMQLRSAKKWNFDFDKHRHDKIGVVRTFVKMKKAEQKRNQMLSKGQKDGNKHVITVGKAAENDDKFFREFAEISDKVSGLASSTHAGSECATASGESNFMMQKGPGKLSSEEIENMYENGGSFRDPRRRTRIFNGRLQQLTQSSNYFKQSMERQFKNPRI